MVRISGAWTCPQRALQAPRNRRLTRACNARNHVRRDVVTPTGTHDGLPPGPTWGQTPPRWQLPQRAHAHRTAVSHRPRRRGRLAQPRAPDPAARARRLPVVTVGDGPTACGRVESAPDLVLLDVGLPGMNGLEVCRRLRADPRTVALPIILVTGRTASATSSPASMPAPTTSSRKPYDEAELMARIRSVLPPGARDRRDGRRARRHRGARQRRRGQGRARPSTTASASPASPTSSAMRAGLDPASSRASCSARCSTTSARSACPTRSSPSPAR